MEDRYLKEILGTDIWETVTNFLESVVESKKFEGHWEIQANFEEN